MCYSLVGVWRALHNLLLWNQSRPLKSTPPLFSLSQWSSDFGCVWVCEYYIFFGGGDLFRFFCCLNLPHYCRGRESSLAIGLISLPDHFYCKLLTFVHASRQSKGIQMLSMKLQHSTLGNECEWNGLLQRQRMFSYLFAGSVHCGTHTWEGSINLLST